MKNSTSFKIISTLGRTNLNQEFLKFCTSVSQSYFRLNGSHLSTSEIQKYIQILQKYTSSVKAEVYLDLPGNKLRIGKLKNHLQLRSEKMVKLKLGSCLSTGDIPIPYQEIFQQTAIGDILHLQDAEIKLEITKIEKKNIMARILEGGWLRSKAGMNFPERQISLIPQSTMLSKQLKQSQISGIQNLALSYVKSEPDLQELKNLCRNIGYFPRIIGKIEHPESLKNLKKICQTADEIWFCRGDLGSLIPWKELGYWQDYSIEMAKNSGKPIMIAGQVFQHLTEHSQPTRSEVVHFYVLRKQGVDGIVLSDETAIGKNPVVALKEIIKLF